tara:strand:+ start:545 stop:2968 length:2424 start_codon:yes stop_codon:yes gene_type:complete
MSSNKTLSVFLKLNSKAFTSGLKKVEGKLNKLSRNLGKIGSSLSTNVSMPLLGLGAVAIKTASEFENSMTKIQTLVGLPADAVEKLGDAVLDLAGKTATGPKELADGLFFLTSAGLDAESAMKALEATAKGSASGLGDMESLALVAAAAQNAYGEETLTASEALDKFGVMAQTGMFKSEELANVLGSQLGLAANLGISMDELGALISTYTRTTGSATDATTGLSGIMMSFAKITPKAERALAKATEGMEGGVMSAEDLRSHLAENGLQGTLLMLQEQFEKTGVPMSEFFANSGALKGVLGVLGNQTEGYVDILDKMAESQGFVNGAFETTSEKSAFKFKQSLASLQTAGIKLGNSLMPVATGIATAFTKMANVFSNFSDEAREKIVKVGLALIAIGPTIIIVSKLVAGFGLLVKAIRIVRATTISFAVAAMALNPVGIAIAAIVGIVGLLIHNFQKVKPFLVDIINYFIDLYNESMIFKMAVEGIKFAFITLFDNAKFYVTQIANLFSGLGNAIVDLLNFRSPKDSLNAMLNDMANSTADFTSKSTDNFNQMMDNIQSKDKIEIITEEDIDNTLDSIGNKVTGFVDKLKGNVGGLFDSSGDSGEPVIIDAEIVAPGINLGDDIELDEDGNPIIKIKGNLDTTDMTESMKELESATQSAFDGMANASDGGTGAMAKAILSNTRDVIKAKVGEATASLAAQIFATTPPPLNVILAAGAGAVVGGIFNQIIPPFAQGGLVTGATLAMVGEGAGTSSINPEVIAPLDKLKSMIGGGGNGRLSGTISGSDILLSNDRSTITQDRVSGSVTNF